METELTININNGLIGLSVLGGTSAYSALSSSLAALDSAAVLKAKKAFTLATPETTPPWQEAADTRPVSAQIVALKRMLSLVDTTKDSSLGDLPDVRLPSPRTRRSTVSASWPKAPPRPRRRPRSAPRSRRRSRKGCWTFSPSWVRPTPISSRSISDRRPATPLPSRSSPRTPAARSSVKAYRPRATRPSPA